MPAFGRLDRADLANLPLASFEANQISASTTANPTSSWTMREVADTLVELVLTDVAARKSLIAINSTFGLPPQH